MPATVTRRHLLALTGLCVATASAGAARLAPAASPVELLSCPVAGIPYYGFARVARHVVPGVRLELVREPANPFDARAIAVLWDGRIRIGYVPRPDNTAPATLMDAGYRLDSIVLESPGRWIGPWIAIRLVENPMAGPATMGQAFSRGEPWKRPHGKAERPRRLREPRPMRGWRAAG